MPHICAVAARHATLSHHVGILYEEGTPCPPQRPPAVSPTRHPRERRSDPAPSARPRPPTQMEHHPRGYIAKAAERAVGNMTRNQSATPRHAPRRPACPGETSFSWRPRKCWSACSRRCSSQQGCPPTVPLRASQPVSARLPPPAAPRAAVFRRHRRRPSRGMSCLAYNTTMLTILLFSSNDHVARMPPQYGNGVLFERSPRHGRHQGYEGTV